MADIAYERLNLNGIKPGMLNNFNRRQEVSQSLRKLNGKWTLIDNAYAEDCDAARKSGLEDEFRRITVSGGALFCAFDEGKAVGFSAVGGEPLGGGRQYLQLLYMHVSCEYRGKGIGKRLFNMAAGAARLSGAAKLYISAHPSRESQLFYRAVGCVEAAEPIPELLEAEPFDVHMEYPLLG